MGAPGQARAGKCSHTPASNDRDADSWYGYSPGRMASSPVASYPEGGAPCADPAWPATRIEPATALLTGARAARASTGQWGAEGFDGTLERLQAQIGVTGWPRAEVRLAGRLTPQRFGLAHLHVRLPQSEVRGSGALTLPHRQVQLRLEIPRLQLDEVGFEPPVLLPRWVQGVIDVRGSVSAPQVEARLQYAEAQLDLDLTAQLEEPSPRYSATLRLDHLKMAHVLAGEPGTLRALLQIQGTGFAASQRRAEAELRLETSGLTLAPGLTARVQANLTNSTVRFEDVQVRSAPVVVVARGTLSATAPTALTYDVTLRDLTPLQRTWACQCRPKGSSMGLCRGFGQPSRHVIDFSYASGSMVDCRASAYRQTLLCRTSPRLPR